MYKILYVRIVTLCAPLLDAVVSMDLSNVKINLVIKMAKTYSVS